MKGRDIKDEGLEMVTDRFYSIYRGLVYSNQDPECLGRLQLIVPALWEEAHEYWALPIGIPYGAELGEYLIPNKDDLVWVQFENGDPRYPVWNYGPVQIDNRPVDKDGKPAPTTLKLIYSKYFRVEMNDGTGELRIVDNKNNNTYTADANGISMVQASGKTINFGKLGAATYKGVLGEKLKDLLSNLMDLIKSLTVMTAMGTSSTPINSPAITQLQQTIDTILSIIVTIEK